MKPYFNIEEEITFVISEILKERRLWLQKVYNIFYSHKFIRGVFGVTSMSKNNVYYKIYQIANQVEIKKKRLYFLNLFRRYLGNIQKALEHEKKDRHVGTIKMRLQIIDDLKAEIKKSINMPQGHREMEEAKKQFFIS